MTSSPRVAGTVLLVGPTAAGKSALAMALAATRPLEIVNADALQVYRGLDLGTAKPSAADRRAVPHHLVDILDPREPFSAGEFRRRALPVLADIHQRGKLALVVGGSGFYLRALTRGLSPIPPVPRSIRAAVREQAVREGPRSVRRRLEAVDPAGAAEIAAEDTQRTQRALEVFLATGRSLREWWRDRPPEGGPSVLARIGLTVPRPLLYDRITRRIQHMAEAGWVDEVKELLAAGCPLTAPAFQAIGYRQVIRHVQGEWPLDRALHDAARETRRFAKRQLTWFRAETGIDWIEAEDVAEALPQAHRILRDRTGEWG